MTIRVDQFNELVCLGGEEEAKKCTCNHRLCNRGTVARAIQLQPHMSTDNRRCTETERGSGQEKLKFLGSGSILDIRS